MSANIIVIVNGINVRGVGLTLRCHSACTMGAVSVIPFKHTAEIGFTGEMEATEWDARAGRCALY
jgi:hypothetical protein